MAMSCVYITDAELRDIVAVIGLLDALNLNVSLGGSIEVADDRGEIVGFIAPSESGWAFYHQDPKNLDKQDGKENRKENR